MTEGGTVDAKTNALDADNVLNPSFCVRFSTLYMIDKQRNNPPWLFHAVHLGR